jgi:hypothetical protein
MSAHRLPESGLLVRLPVKLNAPLDGEFREELGFEPDWWVPAGDALNRAVAAIRAGTIATVQPLPAAVLATDFVPEKPPLISRGERRRLVQIAVVLLAGPIVLLANRRRYPLPFAALAGGLLAGGVLGFGGNEPAQLLALALGAVYGGYAGLLAWRRRGAC